jgi:protein PhnA
MKYYILPSSPILYIMKLFEQLHERSNHKCELCKSAGPLKIYEVPPSFLSKQDRNILICDKCLSQLEKKEEPDSNHWKCLTEVMWSELPAIQVVAWRMLNRLKLNSWAMDNLEMMYLDEDTLAWAKATGDHNMDGTVAFHKDSNGHVLTNGDTVILTKSLEVKGAKVNAKIGTVVKNIHIVENNTEQIEGRIDGQMIVILSKFVRKQNN